MHEALETDFIAYGMRFSFRFGCGFIVPKMVKKASLTPFAEYDFFRRTLSMQWTQFSFELSEFYLSSMIFIEAFYY